MQQNFFTEVRGGMTNSAVRLSDCSARSVCHGAQRPAGGVTLRLYTRCLELVIGEQSVLNLFCAVQPSDLRWAPAVTVIRALSVLGTWQNYPPRALGLAGERGPASSYQGHEEQKTHFYRSSKDMWGLAGTGRKALLEAVSA